MEKLVKKFKEVFWSTTPEAAYYEDVEHEQVFKNNAEECKKIAITFAEYHHENRKYFDNENNTVEYNFNKFIEEEYGE